MRLGSEPGCRRLASSSTATARAAQLDRGDSRPSGRGRGLARENRYRPSQGRRARLASSSATRASARPSRLATSLIEAIGVRAAEVARALRSSSSRTRPRPRQSTTDARGLRHDSSQASIGGVAVLARDDHRAPTHEAAHAEGHSRTRWQTQGGGPQAGRRAAAHGPSLAAGARAQAPRSRHAAGAPWAAVASRAEGSLALLADQDGDGERGISHRSSFAPE